MKKHLANDYNNNKKLSQLCSRKKQLLKTLFWRKKTPVISFAGKQLKPWHMRSEDLMQKRRGLQKAVKQLTSWKDSPPQCRHPHSSNLMLPIPPHSSEPGLSLTFKIITNFHFNKAISDQKLRCKRGYPCQPQTLPLSCRSPRQGCTLQGDFLGVIPKWLAWPLIVTEIHLLRLQSFNQRIPLFPEQ